jgi:hypothetical protein
VKTVLGLAVTACTVVGAVVIGKWAYHKFGG